MKKLLLFVIMLFGIFSVQSLADSSGCGVTIPIELCRDPSGNYGNSGSIETGDGGYPVGTMYGAVYLDPVTRNYGAVWNYNTGTKAADDASGICKSNRCTGNWFGSSYVAISVSDDDKIVGYATGYKYSNVMKESLKKCKNEGGVNCSMAITGSTTSKPTYFYWGGLSYDRTTGDSWMISGQLKRKDAVAIVAKPCKSSCPTFTFQEKYGALALSPNGTTALGVSEKSSKDAEKDALKNCQKQSKEKECKIVGNAKSSE